MEFKFFGNRKERPQTQKTISTAEVKKQHELGKEGFKPIRACLIDSTKPLDEITIEAIERIKKDGLFVDYDGENTFLEKNNLRNAGENSYVISESNEEPKYTERVCNCTVVVGVGEEIGSKKQISFMSHQDPDAFLSDKKENFTTDLIEATQEFKKKVKENSIDILVLGGRTGFWDEYEESIKCVADVFTKEFSLEPTIMTGPNTKMNRAEIDFNRDSTGVYLDTQNRRLYILRPSQESKVNEDYLPSELENKKKDWGN
ncbi:MAG: hypothetical protein WCX46_03570 [Candidatus Paceibacterota bacterium]